MSWENLWFPADFPLSQPIELNKRIQLKKFSESSKQFGWIVAIRVTSNKFTFGTPDIASLTRLPKMLWSDVQSKSEPPLSDPSQWR